MEPAPPCRAVTCRMSREAHRPVLQHANMRNTTPILRIGAGCFLAILTGLVGCAIWAAGACAAVLAKVASIVVSTIAVAIRSGAFGDMA